MNANDMNKLFSIAPSTPHPINDRVSTARRAICLNLCRWLVVFVAALVLLLVEERAQACGSGPDAGGNPNKPGQCTGVGNPINVMTGNKYQREEDLPALPGVLGLELVRHYNSAFSAPGHPNGVFGRGWRLSYETELVDRWGKVQVLEADGGRVIFDRDPKVPTGCSTPDAANGTMAIGRQQDGQPDYTWTWTDGRKLHFNAVGKLDRITAPTGEIVRLLYDSENVLVRVIDPQGRSLNLVYYDRHTQNQFHGVQFIDTPVGRFSYEYGSALPKGAALFDQRQLLANLVRVRMPDQLDPDKRAHALSSRGTTRSTTSRIYHHEDPRSPWLMTGISAESAGTNGKPVATRYATYGYDDAGRAILSKHAGNVDKITLDSHEAGKTVLTNSLGQKTVYRYTVIADEYRLLEVRGAGCALCGEPNVRYRYDAAGRLLETTKLTDSGQPLSGLRVERDNLGRIMRLDRIPYDHGKPQAAQPQARFEYRGAGFAPALVARPSVVLGQERVTRIEYNAAGQVLRVAESGWSPAVVGRQAAERISRAVRYRYATISERSLLVEIDGPLPNGRTSTPADSDVTLVEYDHRRIAATAPTAGPDGDRLARYDGSGRDEGVVTAIIAPGNRRSEIEYDYAGRIASVKDSDGHATSLGYSPRGQLLNITNDGVTYRTLYDAFGQPVESGYGDSAHYRALARFGYDEAGRNTWTASVLGIVQTRRFDTEGELLETSTLSSTMKVTQRYEYDGLGHLQAVTDASGGTRRIGWNALGLPGMLTDALGRTMRFGYDIAGNITAVADAANAVTRFELDAYNRPAAVIAPNGATTRYIRDDFGRIVATTNPDSGTTIRCFDAADRLVASVDANGNRTSYEYDVLGRIVLQRVTDNIIGGAQSVTTWRYVGTHLVAVDHPNQAERYSYDADGRLSTKTVILALAGGVRGSYTTRYLYNAMGQLAGIGLPDGSTLDYRRNGQNQIIALERSPAIDPWLRRVAPRQTIVRDLERDVVGLRHLAYGNGIEAYYQRSKEGSLGRIVYRDPRMQAPSEQGRTALETLSGLRPAFAAPMPALPGALGLPSDPKALLDHRYLWDVQRNLLYTRDQDAENAYAYDARDRLIASATVSMPMRAQGGAGTNDAGFTRYYYDDNGNRLLAQEGISQSEIQGRTVKASYEHHTDRWRVDAADASTIEADYDAAGQPQRIGNRGYVWDAFGHLLEVREGQHVLVRYRYNHLGERIEKVVDKEHTYYLYRDRQLAAELDGQGQIRRQYVYLAGQPVAVIDSKVGNAHDGKDTGLAGGIANLWRAWSAKGEAIAYLQTNHLGAVEMVTDASGKPIWHAHYAAYGKLLPAPAPAHGKALAGTSGFVLNLRLPGQYADRETGLYYNDHRYYDPARGRYLTPDPLGLGGGANGYTYVSGNPLKYVDPEGLVLFAFDGTGNTDDTAWLSANGSSLSNVVQLLKLYGDGDTRYISGVGTPYHDATYGDIIPADYKPWYVPLGGETADMGGNYSGPARIQRMVQYFNNEADLAADDSPMEVDIVGFSRGAAEGRDFANRIVASTVDGWYKYKNAKGQQVCQKVDFRFMGLFDTVLSTNNSDTTYHMGTPAQFAYVAQAVALNEYRGKTTRKLVKSAGAFPLESIMGGIVPSGQTRIESGFIGSHADIGGGFGVSESQLSQVALAWMVSQAQAAGVKMFDSPLLHTIIGNPVIHDKSDNQYSTAPNGAPVAPGIEDRTVRYLNGKSTTQMAMAGAGMTWADTQQFISYLRPIGPLDKGQYIFPLRPDFVKGTVNMQGYLNWLKQHGYNINIMVQ
jgi:RHS repeat-associated protein